MITREFLKEFYYANEERCTKGIESAVANFSLELSNWNKEGMQAYFRQYRMYAAEFEGIMQRILDESEEAVD